MINVFCLIFNKHSQLYTVATSIGAKTRSDLFSYWVSTTPLWLMDCDGFSHCLSLHGSSNLLTRKISLYNMYQQATAHPDIREMVPYVSYQPRCSNRLIYKKRWILHGGRYHFPFPFAGTHLIVDRRIDPQFPLHLMVTQCNFILIIHWDDFSRVPTCLLIKDVF